MLLPLRWMLYGTQVQQQQVAVSGGSWKPEKYRYIPYNVNHVKGYDEEELKRLILEAEDRNKEEIELLEKKAEKLYQDGVKLSEIRSAVVSIQTEMERRVNAQLLFDADLKLKLLETQRRKNMALLLLMAAA